MTHCTLFVSLKYFSSFLLDWIITLGPVVNDQYQYAVVTDSNKLTMFVLARDQDQFRAQYREQILSFLDRQGFWCFWNRPQETYQSEICHYADHP